MSSPGVPTSHWQYVKSLSHAGKVLSCEDANFEVLRILLVSLCQLNVYVDWAVAVPAFTSWLVVKTSLRLRARGLPFSATKEQAGKSSSDCLVAWFGLFLGSFDSRSLQIRCQPSWIFSISHPKISTNSFFHHRFWNFSTAMV